MALRSDQRSWMIYDPNTVTDVFRAMEASALVMFGAWLQNRAAAMPADIRDNLGTIGASLHKIGDARQQINAGLAPNDVPDSLVEAQRGFDRFVQWLHDPQGTPTQEVKDIIDQIAAAMTYLVDRTMETGTNHTRWNSRLVSGEACETCGRS